MNYNTSDLYLAGYLMASGVPLKSNERESGTTIFCFEKTDKLLQLVEDYYNMKAVINPMHYGSALKILKNIVYQKDRHYNYYGNERIYSQSKRNN